MAKIHPKHPKNRKKEKNVKNILIRPQHPILNGLFLMWSFSFLMSLFGDTSFGTTGSLAAKKWNKNI